MTSSNEKKSALLAFYVGNSPVNGEFPSQRPVTRGFDVFVYLRLNQQLSKQWRWWWFETSSSSSWRHWNDRGTFGAVAIAGITVLVLPPHRGLYSLSWWTSYRKISRSLEAARFRFKLFQSPWHLAGTSAALLGLNYLSIPKLGRSHCWR